MPHAVVIGGGVAATSCSESLIAYFKLLRDGASHPPLHVTLVSPAPTVCLGRALSGSARAREVLVNAQDALAWAHGADIEYVRASAVALDVSARRVTLSNDVELRYDALCIGTGAAPRIPPTLRAPDVHDKVHTVRDAGSVHRLRDALKNASHVLVLGNGGVAMEAVHIMRCVHVTWVFRDKHPGATFFDKHAGAALLAARTQNDPATVVSEGPAARVAAAVAAASAADVDAVPGAALGPFWEDAGALCGALAADGTLALRGGCELTRLTSAAHGGLDATLSDGGVVRCDLVVCCTGVVPSVRWALESGLKSGERGGVAVSPGSMRTSAPAVYAAGDCTSVSGSDAGRDWFQRRLWTQASAAGACAGRVMARELCDARDVDLGMEFELFAHATAFFGVKVAFLGRYAAQGLPDGYSILEDGGHGGFVRVVLFEGCMRGALLVGDAVDRAETYENLILDQLQVGGLGEALVDLDKDIADYFD